MVSSSWEDVARALRGQPRLSRNCLRRNGGNVVVVVLISFHSRDVLVLSHCKNGPVKVTIKKGYNQFN